MNSPNPSLNIREAAAKVIRTHDASALAPDDAALEAAELEAMGDLRECLALPIPCPDTDREEMADIGEAFMEALNDTRGHPFMKHWMPADGPSEIIVDLLNALDDQATGVRDALTKAAEAFRAEERRQKRKWDRMPHALSAKQLVVANARFAEAARNRELAELMEAALYTMGGGDE